MSHHIARLCMRTVTATGMSDMLHTHMQSLLNVSVPNNFLARHTHGTLCDVEHYASLAMVVFIRQALLLRRISHNIHNVSHLVRFELHC